MNNTDYQIKVFRRSNGSIGIRNHLAVISTVACANVVAEAIAARIPEAVACTHPYGCDQLGEDLVLTIKTLVNIGKHPNVGAVLVVGLGCEEIIADDLAKQIAVDGKPVEFIVIQDEGGTTKSIDKGVECCSRAKARVQKESEKVLVKPDELIIGVACGGSDYTSGIAANPAVGAAADLLVDLGAKVIFGETSELLGAEHIIVKRTVSLEDENFILNKVQNVEDAARRMRVDIRGAQPSPGNIAGGLSSIEEKSLGAICKSGSRQIVSTLEFGSHPIIPGLSFMDTPGNDIVNICGLVAGGAHMILFTTGRGTPMGFATAPVMKITANSKTAQKMAENIDIDVSSILAGNMSINEAGELMLDRILAVAEGQLVMAEKLGHCEFGLHRIGPTL